MSDPSFDERVEGLLESEGVTKEQKLMFHILDVLRLAHVYALKDSHPEELGEDFKPWKWDGYEKEFALKATKCYVDLVAHLREQNKVQVKRGE